MVWYKKKTEPSMRPSFMFVLCALFVSLLSGTATASDPPKEPAQDETSGGGGTHPKGQTELAILTGFGASHHLWDGVTGVHFLTVGARLGHVVSQPRGPGFLKGNLEVVGEFLPLYHVDLGATTYGASFTLLGRHFFRPSSTWRPYAVLGLGVLVTGQQIPENSSRLNFTPQAGIGITFATRHGVNLYAEYRIHHISAGHRTPAGNPGINSSYLQFSVSLRHW